MHKRRLVIAEDDDDYRDDSNSLQTLSNLNYSTYEKWISDLTKRFRQTLEPSIAGNRPCALLTGDPGIVSFAVALSVCWRPLPEYNHSWSHNELIKATDTHSPVEILYAMHINLVPQDVVNGSPKIVGFVSTMADKLNMRPTAQLNAVLERIHEDIRKPLPEPPTRPSPFITLDDSDSTERKFVKDKSPAEDLITASLASETAILALDFAKEYVHTPRGVYNLTRQMIKVLVNPEMRWIWACPAPVRIENQLELSKFYRNKARVEAGMNAKASGYNPVATTGNDEEDDVGEEGIKDPMVWYLCNLMQGLIMMIDSLLFGSPRDCRFYDCKYGKSNAELIAHTQRLHPRAKSKYTMRKYVAAESVTKTCEALGLWDFLNFYMITLPSHDIETHHMGDALGIAFHYYAHAFRNKAYNTSELQKVEKYLSNMRKYRDRDCWMSESVELHISHATRLNSKKKKEEVIELLEQRELAVERAIKRAATNRDKARREAEKAAASSNNSLFVRSGFTQPSNKGAIAKKEPLLIEAPRSFTPVKEDYTKYMSISPDDFLTAEDHAALTASTLPTHSKPAAKKRKREVKTPKATPASSSQQNKITSYIAPASASKPPPSKRQKKSDAPKRPKMKFALEDDEEDVIMTDVSSKSFARNISRDRVGGDFDMGEDEEVVFAEDFGLTVASSKKKNGQVGSSKISASASSSSSTASTRSGKASSSRSKVSRPTQVFDIYD